MHEIEPDSLIFQACNPDATWTELTRLHHVTDQLQQLKLYSVHRTRVFTTVSQDSEIVILAVTNS